ncbi:helix-turn-helix transcriptional regulator [Fructilactobacillus myrtifloralis]|uniref:Helix-turn-helix transcriptional regulator n=1 Tax=Fructilactobacillus myrtifloralis TaxID=2940301 RepID=A0ABY5BNT5_9LACO|nr:helix-turn-helix domain-containing protein [Fructilactobacillus myrtifloralis]USS85262.1 helix-turn-helix transcriptional regulator [Fructilactobacillus myrtifloralis]
MGKKRMRDEACLCASFQEAFRILGRKWNGMIIQSLLVSGPLRFGELALKVADCSDRVLTARLKELQACGIVTRKTSADSALILYDLTPKGQDLRPVMEATHAWADKWCNQHDEA